MKKQKSGVYVKFLLFFDIYLYVSSLFPRVENMNMKTILVIIAIVAASFALVTTTNVKVTGAIDNSSSIINTTTTTTAIRAHAGGGNSTDMLAVFVPQQAQVSVGQSVTWDNPSPVGEPHTVTFVLDNKTATGIASPFAAVPNSTQFMPLPPGSNSELLKAPGKNNVVIGVNARSYIPAVIDSQGNVKHFAPNAAYTMNGSEKYVNSGWLLPKGQQQLYPGSSNTFTVTFQKAGTYKYLCEIHPWMQGLVTVK
jgi:plastocyanin